MYQAAYRLLRNIEDAEDLVQDVLVKLYPRLDEVERIEALRPWLLRIVYHSYVDFLRKRQRSPVTVSDDLPDLAATPDANEPQEMVSRQETATRLSQAVEQLPEDQRALVDLHLVQGYTLSELVGVFDAPIGTLKARVHRVKKRLKRDLADATFSSF
jgi:RNA polymerase sigma-70 factor (ECF subfamily)